MKDISKTAHLVAMYRALASECLQFPLQDPFARLLAGSQGELLVAVMGEPQQGMNAIAIRTQAIDQMILRLLASEKIGIVLNLGAGLDARPYRLPLPPTLRWVDVDLPDILTYKEQKLQAVKPVCQIDRVKLDLTDRALRHQLLTKINATNQPVLVLTEGILPYLTETQVAELATDLRLQPNMRWWMFELASPFLAQQARQNSGQKIFDQYFANGQPTLLFAPKAGTAFFQTYGWQLQELRSIWSESQFLPKFAGMSAILLRLFAKKYWQAINKDSGFVLIKQI
jgi:methyltransferase (TIGR00027 family)